MKFPVSFFAERVRSKGEIGIKTTENLGTFILLSIENNCLYRKKDLFQQIIIYVYTFMKTALAAVAFSLLMTKNKPWRTGSAKRTPGSLSETSQRKQEDQSEKPLPPEKESRSISQQEPETPQTRKGPRQSKKSRFTEMFVNGIG